MLAQRNGLTRGHRLSHLRRTCGTEPDVLMRDKNATASVDQAICWSSTLRGRGAIGLEISTNYVAVLLTDLCGDALWRQITAIALGAPQEVVLELAEGLLTPAIEQAKRSGLPCWGSGLRRQAWSTPIGA